MFELRKALAEIQIDKLAIVATHTDALNNLCERENMLFARAQENKPDNAPSDLLLGLFTKLNVEALSSLNAHLDQIQAMQSAIEKQVGAKHAESFKLPVVEELLLVTHIWVYVQGYLGLDYSLANDHAMQTSETLSPLVGLSVDEIRTQFTQSYYQGYREFEAKKPPSSGWKRWFEKWFN
ncbi:hypothetical protein J4N45_24625 [Vibrio sp. SCSIO 43140]|uniref:hypothetical protein n=1 Tax=Vibrio sp. SCSIO 43140 TaxID=2819100 RepID=UPI002076380F|nr:hypothetical protein [Vibrio sp. SCSIO 43140]USD62549.1 hypothetical protein J4N45_24625 [Vibrio sp. SCSIO 43140]